MCAAADLTSSLLTIAFRNRFIRPQLLRPILPDESMTNAMSAIGLHSFSGNKKERTGSINVELFASQTDNFFRVKVLKVNISNVFVEEIFHVKYFSTSSVTLEVS